MFHRLVLAAVLVSCFAPSAAAQTCQWTGKGGKDVKWVKLMYFTRDTKSKEKPAPITGFDSKSCYKRYAWNKADKKQHKINPELLRDWVPEIFGDGGEAKADAWYFLSDAAFQPSDEYSDAESIPLEAGRKFEVGPKCAVYGESKGYIGFKKVQELSDGSAAGEKWYSPIALDELNRAKRSDPLLYFGMLAGVLVVCILIGIVGVKIGDKERALDE